MLPQPYKALCLGLALAILSAGSLQRVYAAEQTLYFVTGDNCPLACKNSERPGLWVEFVRELLAPFGYDTQHLIRPIKRVHHEVQSVTPQSDYVFSVRISRSSFDAHHIPGTLASMRPVLFYRACFAIRKGFQWQYQGTESSSIKMGLAKGVNYSSLEGFLNRSDQAPLNVYTVGQTPTLLNLKLLVSKRIDAMVSSLALIEFLAQQESLRENIAITSCDLNPNPIYFIFPSSHPLTQQLRLLVDTRLDQFRSSGQVASIYARYGMTYRP